MMLRYWFLDVDVFCYKYWFVSFVLMWFVLVFPISPVRLLIPEFKSNLLYILSHNSNNSNYYYFFVKTFFYKLVLIVRPTVVFIIGYQWCKENIYHETFIYKKILPKTLRIQFTRRTLQLSLMQSLTLLVLAPTQGPFYQTTW